MKLTIDFETRSEVDLEALGSWLYAAHPTTEILVLCVGVDDEAPKAWIPPCFRDTRRSEISDSKLVELLNGADDIEAHNIAFEVSIWFNIMTAKFGFPMLAPEKISCSMAKCYMAGIPANLSRACEVMGLPEGKDKEGSGVMMSMKSPLKTGNYLFDAWIYDKLIKYCKQDVIAERELSKVLPTIPKMERSVLMLDHRMNLRGYNIDLLNVLRFIQVRDNISNRISDRLTSMTGFAPTQTKRLLEYIRSFGIPCSSVAANTIDKLLERDDLPDVLRNVLELRRNTGNSSLTKLNSMRDYCDSGGVTRWGLQYHGCGTGRWSGRLIQPQNLIRKVGNEEDFEFFCDPTKSISEIEERFVDNALNVMKTMLRKLLVPKEGNQFYVADFSAIEGRVLAWLANEEKVLEEYRGAGRMYEQAAASVYGCSPDEVTKEQRTIGKVCELALGFGGGVKAFAKMAVNYGVILPEKLIQNIVNKWRENRHKTKRFWYALEGRARDAVQNPGKLILVGDGKIKFYHSGRFLRMILPSGRCLYYLDPYVSEDRVFCSRVDPNNKTQMVERNLYGGLLSENATQAHARDLCVYALFNLEKAGYKPVLMVHDECICEAPLDFGSLEEFTKIMTIVPKWSEGVPIGAESWKGVRYGKG